MDNMIRDRTTVPIPAGRRSSSHQVRRNPLAFDEPDVGILSSRTLFGGDYAPGNHFSYCHAIDSVEMPCFCGDWNHSSGSFRCSSTASLDMIYFPCMYWPSSPCLYTSLYVYNQNGTAGIEYCRYGFDSDDYDVCRLYTMSSDVFVESKGDVGAAEQCSILINGTKCNSCEMQDECYGPNMARQIGKQMHHPRVSLISRRR